MSLAVVALPLPPPLTTEQAVKRLWELQRLHREGALDTRAAALAIGTLGRHPTESVRRAALGALDKIERDLLAELEAAGVIA